MRHLRRRLMLGIIVVAISAFWIQPSAAFNDLANLSRSTSAVIVTDANGYNAITGGTCSTVPITGGTCSFTLTNKGTTGQTYTMVITSDPSTIVTGTTLTPTTEVAVGGTATLSATIRACVCSLQTFTIYYKLTGAKVGKFDSEETRVAMTITYI